MIANIMSSAQRFTIVLPLLMASLSLAACTNIVAPPQEHQELYPLQVGNRWTYIATNPNFTGYFIDEIVGTKRIGEDEYFEFRSGSETSSFFETYYIHQGEDGILYVYRSGKKQVLFDFLRKEGETWRSYDNYRGVIQKKDFSVSVPSGTYQHCMLIFLDIFYAADDEQWFTFAPGIGPVEKRSAWFGLRLVSASVNGRSHP